MINKIKKLAVSLLVGSTIWSGASIVGAEEILTDTENTIPEETVSEEILFEDINPEAMNFEDINSEVMASKNVATGSDVKSVYELHLEYLAGNWSDSRRVNYYNVHLYRKMHESHAFSFYQGLTFSRATGYIAPQKYNFRHLDSKGVGIGPGGLLRWDAKVSGNLHASLDFAGSIMLFNKAHPATGRAYGFLWRLGPRLAWQYGEEDSVGVAYYISHFSNGMHTHNPGTNMRGFSLEIAHKF